MAEDVLVRGPLSGEMIDMGRMVARALLGLGVRLSACFWLFTAERNEWQLVVAFPEVDSEGPKKAYGTVQKALHMEMRSPDNRMRLRLENITALRPNDPLVRAVQSIIRDFPESEQLELTRSRIGDSFVEHIYIYNLTKVALKE